MRPSRARTPNACALFACAVFAGGMAAGPCRAAAPGDPWEGFNRHMFNLEEGLDRHVFGPVSHGYGSAPSGIRSALRNWARNLNEPVIFANDMLQGHVATAAGTVCRFVINSTVGIAGFVDVAGHNGLPRHDNSFGTTLGRWGAGPGPYLFLPLAGPTTVRDGFGKVVDIALDPITWIRFEGRTEIGISATVINGLSERVEGAQDLAHIRETSTDPYATLRSFYLQNRQSEITGKSVDINALPDFDTPTPASPPPSTTPPSTTPPSAAESSDDASATVSNPTVDAAPDDSGGEDPA